jgi:hypothetical protein
MTVLGPRDPLPHTTARMLVTGTSGGDKSTLRETISTDGYSFRAIIVWPRGREAQPLHPLLQSWRKP